MNAASRMNLPSRRATIAFAIKMLCLLAILPISSQLQAQSFFGTIVGTVTDTSGAVVFGATVKVTNVGTGTSQTVTSEPSGRYSAVNLIPGAYKVEVSKTTFKRFVRDNAVVEVGQTTRVDAALQVGAVSETVEVTTNAPLLQTDSSTLNQEIEGQQVQEEPLNGRNVMNLVALTAGVVPTGGAMGTTGLDQGTRTAGGTGFGNYQIGGAIQGQSGNYIDGVANILLGGNALALVPTQDAIQEFNVASSNAGADFGRYSGGVVSMTTKSGANAWHGSVWEYNRNRDYNANDFFSNATGSPRGVWNQNQYGASASGPIKKDKAFFSFTWESLKLLTTALSNTNVPTLAQQNGVFSNVLPADPLYVSSGGATGCNIQPYTGQTLNSNLYTPSGGYPSGGSYIVNLYQPGCGDPTTQVMKQFYPLPNANLPNANFFLATPEGNNQSQYNARVDYALSQKQRFFARYSYWAPTDVPHTEFNDVGYKNGTGGNGTKWPTDDGKSSYFTTQGVVGDTVTINPTTVLDVRLNYLRQYAPNFAQDLNVDESKFGSLIAQIAPGMVIHEQPAFSANGGHNFYGMGNYPNDGINWYNSYGVAASLTKIVGAHSIKVGFEARLMDQSGLNPGGGSGNYSFGNQAWFKDEWANFLAGYSNSGSFKSVLPTAVYMYYQGYYVTDSWQASRDLTINAGLRYELPGAAASRHNAAAVLLPNTVDPITGITGVSAMVGSSLYSGRTTLAAPTNLFAPNLGFAYRVNDKTVVRGGYGISFLPNDISGGWNPSSSVNGASNQWTHSTANGQPAIQMQTDLQNIINSGGVPKSPGRYTAASAQPTLFLSAAAVQPPNNNINTPISSVPGIFATVSTTAWLNKGISGPIVNQAGFPFTQHWNAAISHEFKGNMMVEVSYSGLKGLNMPEAGSRQLNAIPDAIMQSSAFAAIASSTLNASNLNQCNNAGILGTINANYASTYAGNSIANKPTVGQCMRPYPTYSGVSDSLGYIARENYHAFTAKMEKRMGAAGVLSANYTNAKNMGNTDTQAGFVENKATTQGGSGNGGIMDWNNLGGEYSLISYDVTNRTIVSYVTSLPFGKGKKYLNSFGDGMNAVISGWTLNGITTFQSGFPLFFSTNSGYQLGNYGGGSERPLVVPGCNKKIGGSGLARYQNGAWFNTSCFEDVGTTTNNVYGANSPMTNPYLPTGWSTGYLFGNEPRVDPTLRADGQKNFDAAIGKATSIHERANLAFRVEFFNIMNRVQFAPPVTTVGGNNYGTVGYQVNHPRQLQMSLRLNY